MQEIISHNDIQILLMMLRDMAKNFSANFLKIGNIRLVIINQFIRGFANSLVQCAIPHMNNNIHNHRAPKHEQKFIGMQNNLNNHNNNYVIILLFWNV